MARGDPVMRNFYSGAKLEACLPQRLLGAVVLSCALAYASPTLAQVQNAPTLAKPDPDAQEKPKPSLPSTGETLSERLDRSGGVIKPPTDVDQGIHAGPKDSSSGSNMPVIRPPGSPGADQNVKPK